MVYIRLNNGVNAIAHACYDLRTPGKKDDVSFAVTRLDEEKGIAIVTGQDICETGIGRVGLGYLGNLWDMRWKRRFFGGKSSK